MTPRSAMLIAVIVATIVAIPLFMIAVVFFGMQWRYASQSAERQHAIELRERTMSILNTEADKWNGGKVFKTSAVDAYGTPLIWTLVYNGHRHLLDLVRILSDCDGHMAATDAVDNGR